MQALKRYILVAITAIALIAALITFTAIQIPIGETTGAVAVTTAAEAGPVIGRGLHVPILGSLATGTEQLILTSSTSIAGIFTETSLGRSLQLTLGTSFFLIAAYTMWSRRSVYPYSDPDLGSHGWINRDSLTKYPKGTRLFSRAVSQGALAGGD